MIHIYGCPIHTGCSEEGLIGSLDHFQKLYPKMNFELLREQVVEEKSAPNLKNLHSVVKTCNEIANYANSILEAQDFPLFIGGDHSAGMGTVSASANWTDRLGLIWVDAHPDINTDETTESGNIHGMPVAALLGRGERELVDVFQQGAKIRPEDLVFFGLRDIDPGEQVALDELKIRYYTYDRILEMGFEKALAEAVDYLKKTDAVHVSFDLDSMDPKLMPGVSVPVPGGFNYEEADRILEELFENLNVCALDLVEYNEVYDKDDKTAKELKHMIDKTLELKK